MAAAGAQHQAERVILVAEDDRIAQKLIRMQLQILGYRAEVVGDGRSAVEAVAARNDIALVLMDINLPWLDGLAATAEIRATEEASGRRLPIIAMTANIMVDNRDTCLAAGMDEHLDKPITLEQLRAVLDRWIPA